MEAARIELRKRFANIRTILPTRKILPIFCLLVINLLLITFVYSHLQWDRENVVDIKDADELFLTLEQRISAKDRRIQWQEVIGTPTTPKVPTASPSQALSADSIAKIVEHKLKEVLKKRDVDFMGLGTTPSSTHQPPKMDQDALKIADSQELSREPPSKSIMQPLSENDEKAGIFVDPAPDQGVPGSTTTKSTTTTQRSKEDDFRDSLLRDLEVRTTISVENMTPQNPMTPSPNRADNSLSAKDAIQCVTSAMSDFFKELERYRVQMLSVATWQNWETQGLVTVDARDVGDYLARLSEFSSVKVFKVHIALSKLRQCFTHDLHYKYSISNSQCDSAMKLSMFHLRNGLEVYNMSCTNSLVETLKPSPLSPVAFDVGLPLSYKLGSGGDMVSFLNVFQSGIVTSEGDVISGNVKHVIQRCHDERFEEPVPLTVDPNKYALYDELFSMAVMWGAAFYHSNIDALGRLVPYIPFLRKHPTIKIHMTWVWPKFAAKFLSSEGISADRFVHGTVRAKLVYAPASFLCHRPSFFPVHLLGLYMRANLPNEAASRDTVILIYRTPQNRPHLRPRHFKNHDAIMVMLKRLTDKLNLNFWEFRDDPAPDTYQTAQMFNRALLVIAPHGAGEVNLVFTQPGTVLIEGLCMREFKSFSMAFRNLAHLQGGIYHGVYNAHHQCEETTPQEILEPVLFFLEHFGYRIGT